MDMSAQSVAEKPQELWLPHPAGGWERWGWILVVGGIGLVPGLFTAIGGHLSAGAALLAVDLVLVLLFLSWPAPYGVLLTTGAVKLQRRSFFLGDDAELPRAALIELWIEEKGEHRARLYVYADAPDGQAHAIPLPLDTVQAREQVQQGAARVQELLLLPLVSTFFPPAPVHTKGNFVAEVSAGFALHDANQSRIEQAAVRALTASTSDKYDLAAEARAITHQMRILHSFGSLPDPEAWFLSAEHQSLVHQTSRTEQTEYRRDEIVGVTVEPETIAEEHGTDSDSTYYFAYRVFIDFATGERRLICRCASSERPKTEQSDALRDARWIAQFLQAALQLS
jgi:hypothetical protein